MFEWVQNKALLFVTFSEAGGHRQSLEQLLKMFAKFTGNYLLKSLF